MRIFSSHVYIYILCMGQTDELHGVTRQLSVYSYYRITNLLMTTTTQIYTYSYENSNRLVDLDGYISYTLSLNLTEASFTSVKCSGSMQQMVLVPVITKLYVN